MHLEPNIPKMNFPALNIIPIDPTNFTTTIPGTNAPLPSYHTTKLTPTPDMLSGGTVELIFTRQLTVENFSNTWRPDRLNPANVTNLTYTLSGSIGCGGTDLKLSYNLRVVGDSTTWSGGSSKTIITTNADGTKLDSFGIWVARFVSRYGS